MLKPTEILTGRQLLFLDKFSQSNLVNSFSLSGGTALCGFYLPYRYSEDLDFFSEHEFASQSILIWLKSIKNDLRFSSFDIQTSFNRNLIFLKFGNEILKTEFTFFPFPAIKSNKYKNIIVDSIQDIALNKLFTIYQNPRLRDYMDLYKIILQEKYSLQNLRKDAKIKFDWNIDPIQLGSQLLKVKESKDFPKLFDKFDYHAMENFYRKIALELKNEFLK